MVTCMDQVSTNVKIWRYLAYEGRGKVKIATNTYPLVTGPSRFCLLYEVADLDVVSWIIANAFSERILVMSRKRRSVGSPAQTAEVAAEDGSLDSCKINVALKPKHSGLGIPELSSEDEM